ncbi:hypothetical protein AAHB57_28530 [Bacillus cereus]
MELLYLWIEGFNEGLMKEQGFNFDSRFKYQLHPQGDGGYKLSIKANPNYLYDFLNLNIRMLNQWQLLIISQRLLDKMELVNQV